MLKQHSKLPVDPPFGPLPPPADWSDAVQTIAPLVSPLVSACEGGDCYPALSGSDKAMALSNITTAMSAWYAWADSALQSILGVTSHKPGRGEIVATVKVNVINTFKCWTGGLSIVSKTLRWVRARFAEISAAILSWAQLQPFSSALKAWQRLHSLVNASCAKGKVKGPFARFKLDCAKTWCPRILCVCKQIRQLLYNTGFMIADLNLGNGIAARCDIYSIMAYRDAVASEKADVKWQNAKWREWAQNAALDAAPLAHKYSKPPLTITKGDHFGDNLSRADNLALQVKFWSGLWGECPLDALGPINIDGIPPPNVSRIGEFSGREGLNCEAPPPSI